MWSEKIFPMTKRLLLSSLGVLVLMEGCSNSLPTCPVILDPQNGNNKLKLIANSQDKVYSAVLTCGQSKPTIVNTYKTCLSETTDKATIEKYFSFCVGDSVVTPSPSPNGGRFASQEDSTTAPLAKQPGGSPANTGAPVIIIATSKAATMTNPQPGTPAPTSPAVQTIAPMPATAAPTSPPTPQAQTVPDTTRAPPPSPPDVTQKTSADIKFPAKRSKGWRSI